MTAPEINRTKFARFVERSLNTARTRGMTDRDIEAATGIKASTFHRWRRGEVVPQIPTIEKFCRGLNIPVRDAHEAIRSTGRLTPAPEPPMDPDVLRVLRKLADPSTPRETKILIREMLRYLARLTTPEADDALRPPTPIRKVSGDRAAARRQTADKNQPAQKRRQRMGA